MKVTLLGHASVLVEMAGLTCLMDPVFYDPFEEGAVVSCPRRTVYPEKLPPIDLIILSHRHADHFDIPSLARLPRDCEVICPDDVLLVYTLKKLGFARVAAVRTMEPLESSEYVLFPTHSEFLGVHEMGMIFHDRSGTFFNQVDTDLSPQTIEAMLERFGRIDLLFAMYASQNFDFFGNRTTSFPFEQHQQNLANALSLRPRLVAPGSAGFRFSGDREWLNAYLFPVSSERFVTDLRRLEPTLDCRIMNPGDVFEIDPTAVRHLPGEAQAAVMEEDDTWRIRFDPTAPIPPLSDPNPEGSSIESLAVTTAELIRSLASFVQNGLRAKDMLVQRYHAMQASYGLGVIFPDDSEVWHRFDFTENSVRHASGTAAVEPPEVYHRIAASALVAWAEHKKSYFYVRAYSRVACTLYELGREGPGLHVKPRPMPDLLIHWLLNIAPGSQLSAKDRADNELARFVDA